MLGFTSWHLLNDSSNINVNGIKRSKFHRGPLLSWHNTVLTLLQECQKQQCSSDDHARNLENHGLLLKSGQIDFAALSNTLESFFGERTEKESRRIGKQPTNSPMVIKFHE